MPGMEECPETGQYGNNLVGKNTVIFCTLSVEEILEISQAISKYIGCYMLNAIYYMLYAI